MRTPDALRSPSALRRWLADSATERLPYKFAALFFAIVLWLIVGAEEPTEDWVQVAFQPSLERGLELIGPLPVVRARVSGRGRELLKLYATAPVIRRAFGMDSPDAMRVDLGVTDVDLPIGVSAIVREVEPRSVTLTFRPTAERRLPVRSALRIAPDDSVVLVGTPRFEPDSVVVTGRRRVVRDLTSVPTVGADIVADGDARLVMVDLDTAAIGARVVPSRVRLLLNVRRESPVVRAPSPRANDGGQVVRNPPPVP